MIPQNRLCIQKKKLVKMASEFSEDKKEIQKSLEQWQIILKNKILFVFEILYFNLSLQHLCEI